MDSVPRAPHPDQPRLMLASPLAAEAQESSGEPADDPYSPGPQPLPYLLGVLIALATAVVPLATVVAGRPFSYSAPSFDGSGAALQQKSFIAESLKDPGRISKASRVDQSR